MRLPLVSLPIYIRFWLDTTPKTVIAQQLCNLLAKGNISQYELLIFNSLLLPTSLYISTIEWTIVSPFLWHGLSISSLEATSRIFLLGIWSHPWITFYCHFSSWCDFTREFGTKYSKIKGFPILCTLLGISVPLISDDSVLFSGFGGIVTYEQPHVSTMKLLKQENATGVVHMLNNLDPMRQGLLDSYLAGSIIMNVLNRQRLEIY